MNEPGTVPPKVQNVYFTPSEISFSTSRTSSSTMTLAGLLRPVAGGTSGGLVRIALTGAPTGGPKSPLAEPPVSPGCVASGASCISCAPAVGLAARATGASAPAPASARDATIEIARMDHSSAKMLGAGYRDGARTTLTWIKTGAATGARPRPPARP
jgi:hypothetical protein